MPVRIKYNGRRYPRTVSIRGGTSRAFLVDRRELDLDDYDAYVLLKANSRLTPNTWEFNVLGVIEGKPKEPERPLPEVKKTVTYIKKEETKPVEKIEEPPKKTKKAMSAGGPIMKRRKK